MTNPNGVTALTVDLALADLRKAEETPPPPAQEVWRPSMSLALPLPAGYRFCWKCQAAKLPHECEADE